jgi:DNA-binding CsgD family transcriptional regulator
LKRKQQIPIVDDFIIDRLCDAPYNATEDKKYQLLFSAIDKLDKKCKRLIMLNMEGKTNTEIALIMGFKNSQAVADKKNSCKKMLREAIVNSKEYRELIDEYE